MRDLINQIAQSYRSARVAAQDPALIEVSAQEADSKKPVVIQILRSLLPQDPQIAARFRALAQGIRQLNHPNIAAIRDVGEKGGLPYVVVRALEKAQPLATRLGQPWAVDAAADVAMQAGEALEHAYKKGVLHGNLTPDSLWVEENGHVQVTGLGIRQILDLLQVKAQQAKPGYAAPERLAGKLADARTDIYSLAAVLYSLLARRAPVVIQGKVLPPSRFNADVPAQMDEVIVKALAQDAAGRYPDVHSFVAALGAVMLAPAIRAAVTRATAPRICPKCGTRNKVGRFCTKCGAALPEPAADQAEAAPEAQAVLPGAETEEAPEVRAGLAVVTTGELSVRFPDPLPMPEIGLEQTWARLAGDISLAMPTPPEMPVIDWAEIAPPMPEIPAIKQA
jgi:hypothetical protein